MRDYSLTETAELVRQALKTAFPKTKFSVKSSRYSMGCSISVRWTDGPRTREVDKILQPFEGANFDGMQDLKTSNPPSEFHGEPCKFHVDYVQGQRHESAALLEAAAAHVAEGTGLPLLNLVNGGFDGGEDRVPWHYFPSTYPGNEKGGVLANDSHEGGGEWYSQLVYQVAHDTATEEQAPAPALPHIAAKVGELVN